MPSPFGCTPNRAHASETYPSCSAENSEARRSACGASACSAWFAVARPSAAPAFSGPPSAQSSYARSYAHTTTTISSAENAAAWRRTGWLSSRIARRHAFRVGASPPSAPGISAKDHASVARSPFSACSRVHSSRLNRAAKKAVAFASERRFVSADWSVALGNEAKAYATRATSRSE